MIETESFGRLRDGRPVHLYRIRNGQGEYVELLDYGASIHSIVVRDGAGNPGDVTLGAPSADCLEEFNLEGVTVGRYANLISEAAFTLDGKRYQLDVGRGGHCLHSGSGNYGKRLFEAQAEPERNRVTFVLADGGEGGFEAPALASVRFSFDERSQVTIEYELTALETTVFSPTNHTYFNLGCEDARDHLLQIAADRYVLKNQSGVPDGRTAPVAGTELDFREESRIGRGGREYDDNLLLTGSGFRPVARLRCQKSGRCMEVCTDMPSLTLFTFGGRRQIPGKYGEVYSGFRSVCLETQYPVNAVNCPAFPSPVFQKGERFHSVTAYRFFCGG